MLYIDGISLNIIKEDLKKEILNKKINRIFKNNEHSISLHFGKIELLFSCLPKLAICYINQNKEKPILDIASSIISNLRKHLMNAMLIKIEQLGFDRILVFHFTRINELGELKKYYIYFECLAKSTNFIFCDEEHKVIDSLKKFSISENTDRTLFNGEKYKRPQFTEKKSPFSITREEFEALKIKGLYLVENIEGLGKLFENSAKDYESYKKLLDEHQYRIYFKDKQIKLATVLALDISDYDEIKDFNNFNDLINFYISYDFNSTNFTLLKNRLLTNIDKKNKKLKRTLSLINKDIVESKIMNTVKEQADILAANLYSIKKGLSFIEVFDFYNNKNIIIELDTMLNPKENLDKLYKRYNKLKRGLENAQRRYKEVSEDLNYLDSVLVFIENSNNVEELREIEEELIKQKVLSPIHQTKKTKLKKELKYGLLNFENYQILHGRNNTENDNLTFKIANKNDYWFHAKNIPSSHIIVKTDYLNEEIIKKAAEITAFYTRLKMGEKVEIDYTQKKYVNKPANSKPGFVTYTNQKTILVEKKGIN
ncbi:Rqc2 family fibronectin-binding protein [Fusobacterium russii]|uniref:Rqc2 family fibronectin-binding protein n=1 Tax=Fusobacterium russii TaxID=854 RepID=UPI00039BC6C4|nr:NFACT family protein [Fusobacterium russii]